MRLTVEDALCCLKRLRGDVFRIGNDCRVEILRKLRQTVCGSVSLIGKYYFLVTRILYSHFLEGNSKGHYLFISLWDYVGKSLRIFCGDAGRIVL